MQFSGSAYLMCIFEQCCRVMFFGAVEVGRNTWGIPEPRQPFNGPRPNLTSPARYTKLYKSDTRFFSTKSFNSFQTKNKVPNSGIRYCSRWRVVSVKTICSTTIFSTLKSMFTEMKILNEHKCIRNRLKDYYIY